MSSNGPIPCDETAEARIIAGVIYDAQTYWPKCKRLRGFHFHSALYRLVFDRMSRLASDGTPIDMLSIADAVHETWRPAVSQLPDGFSNLQHGATAFDVAILRLHEALLDRRLCHAHRQNDSRFKRKLVRAALDEFEANTITDDTKHVLARTVLASCAFDPTKKPPPLRPVFTLAGVPICTPGNISVINAQIKAGKSALVGAMLAAAMTADEDADTLSIEASNPDGLALIHIDTEQSADDYWHLIDKALRRANVKEKPDWLLSYHFTGKPAPECRELLQAACIDAKERFEGIFAAIVDGIADLVISVNDPGECNPFVTELQGTAIRYDMPLTAVLHFNPQTARNTVDKSRGHLGSQLERKAETNLILEKKNEITTCWSTKQRRAPILKKNGPSFKWSDEHGMHVSCQTPALEKETAKLDKARREAQDVFAEHKAMKYNVLKSTVMLVLTVSEKTAERRIDDWTASGVIQKAVANLYEMVP